MVSIVVQRVEIEIALLWLCRRTTKRAHSGTPVLNEMNIDDDVIATLFFPHAGSSDDDDDEDDDYRVHLRGWSNQHDHERMQSETENGN